MRSKNHQPASQPASQPARLATSAPWRPRTFCRFSARAVSALLVGPVSSALRLRSFAGVDMVVQLQGQGRSGG